MHITTESKSTNRILVIESVLEPPLNRIKKIDINWREIGDVTVPIVSIEYYPPELVEESGEFEEEEFCEER